VIRDLAYAHPVLRARFEKLRAIWDESHPRERLRVTCVWRSPVEQKALWDKGRVTAGPKVTNCDGSVRMSQHNYNPSRAIDVVVLVEGVGMGADLSKVYVATWEIDKYAALGPLCDEVGLVWGGRFPGLRDAPHVELPKDVAQVGG